MKQYDGKTVLKIDNLAFAAGKIYGLIGPSGAGKSTLLRILNLLEPPTGGKIYFKGIAVEGKAKHLLNLRRKMTMVFQHPVLFDTSVYENVMYGLKVRGVSQREAKRLVEQALEDVGLAEFAQRNACSLSGGEAQRIALARAMVLKPEVLLLDEPTSNLDPANVAVVERSTRRLNEKHGTTVIMVTHNIFQAQRMAEEVLFFYRGRLVEKGPTQQVFHNPEDERTRAFIKGEMVY
ncbi:MAG: phosphate ABC transporter ATP-binding protein [Thermoanaerobacteraceae bacterium]|nr:phosphate ABC transporter ATP-binding protein [Thermoanaerobacteraceae bacterium]